MESPDLNDLEFPDPNDFESEEAEMGTRAEFAETLAQNGFHDVLVLSRDNVLSFKYKEHLEILKFLEEHAPCTVSEISEEFGYSEDCTDRYILNFLKLDIIEFNKGVVRLKHNHVVIEPIV